MSQIDLAKPHEHRTIHDRDSVSIFAAHCGGRMATKNFWIELIDVISLSFLLRVEGEIRIPPAILPKASQRTNLS